MCRKSAYHLTETEATLFNQYKTIKYKICKCTSVLRIRKYIADIHMLKQNRSFVRLVEKSRKKFIQVHAPLPRSKYM